MRTSDFKWEIYAYMWEVMQWLMVCIGYVTKAQILFIDHSCTFMYPCTLYMCFHFGEHQYLLLKVVFENFIAWLLSYFGKCIKTFTMDVLDIWFICPKFWFSHIIDCRKALLSMGNVGGIELLMSWKVCMGSFF